LLSALVAVGAFPGAIAQAGGNGANDAAIKAHEMADRFARGRANEERKSAAEGEATRPDVSSPTGDIRRRAHDHTADLDEISRKIEAARIRRLGKAWPVAGGTGKATVLLIMEPGRRGIRAIARSADPVLCIDYDCYISRGFEAPSLKVNRRKAFGVSNTLGRRAGACSGNTHCVFRDVELAGTTIIQPVDLRLLRHDRRVPRQVEVDRSCQMSEGHLVCYGGLRTADYTVWIVPEGLAEKIGRVALLDALDRGLRGPSRAALAQ
jgi:colicin import membrane protein